MNKRPKVSVIVPIFNVEKYLRQSILSIINQSIKDIEIILIDDGSTDNSLHVIKELSSIDKRIKILVQPNYGQSVARNVGLVNAVGEYIYFFDSDDILEPSALEECYEKCKSQHLDFLFFDADVFGDDSIPMNLNYSRINRFEDKTYNGIDLLTQQIALNSFSASVCLMFIDREYLLKYNFFFYPKIIHEDELFVLFIYLKAKQVGLISKVFFHRRIRAFSTMTSNFGEKNILGYLTVIREIKKHLTFSDYTIKEKNILKKRLAFIIDVLITRLIETRKEDCKYYKRYNELIKKEFFCFMKHKTKFKVLFPDLFYFLKKQM